MDETTKQERDALFSAHGVICQSLTDAGLLAGEVPQSFLDHLERNLTGALLRMVAVDLPKLELGGIVTGRLESPDGSAFVDFDTMTCDPKTYDEFARAGLAMFAPADAASEPDGDR